MQSATVGRSARSENAPSAPFSGWRAAIAASLSTVRRQGNAIAADFARVRRLPALVARAGAAGRWTEADRREADAVARSVVRVGVWCVVLAMPGGLLLLPLLATGDRDRS
jgi:hypothetical protein